MKTLPLLFASCAVVAIVVAVPVRAAHACSGPVCYGTRSFVLPESGTIPSNAPGLAHYVGMDLFDAAAREIKLTELAPSDTGAVAFTRQGGEPSILVPATALTAGARYRLEVSDPCPSSMPATVSEFDVGPPAPLPTALGASRVVKTFAGELQVNSGATCSEVIQAAQVEVDVELVAEAAPWRDLFAYSTFVDGVAWRASASATSRTHPGASWQGRARDLVYASCGSSSSELGGVSPGKHTVTFRATIAGTDVNVESTGVEIQLECPSQPNAASDDSSTNPNQSGASSSCSASRAPRSGSGALGVFAFALGLGAAACRARRSRS